ncbi:MAG TPA: glutathione S-transferase family protein [Gaiellaceae bacterium]|nr:glutathione S-transferase family protein [Gaiellaceae bacterium]HWJ45751.1 glutathione S-transferase family protein [Gaiellaceae bacterium]
MRLYDYAASANCFKVRLLLAHLGIEHERAPIDIFAGDTLTDEFARINPARTTPVLEDPPGVFLQESNAILLELARGSAFLPDDPQVYRWLFYEQADVVPTMGGLRFRLITGRLAPDDPEAQRRRAASYDVLELLDAHLAGHDFFVGGAYSVADIGIYGYVHVAGEAGLDLTAYASLRAWLDRVPEQPGYMNDLEPYPSNSHAGASRSIYD